MKKSPHRMGRAQRNPSMDYRLYPPYNGHNAVGGKGIDKMIDQLIAEYDDLLVLPSERRALFFHCDFS